MNNMDSLPQQEVRPWVRYWARMVDIIIFSLVMPLLFVMIANSLVFADLLKMPSLLTICILSIYILFEPLLLSTWGTTLGKALFRVKVRNIDGSKLSYTQALKRTFLLTLKGQGFGIPLVSLITHIVAYNRLVDNHQTSWDRDGGHQVTHQKIGVLRIIISLIPFILVIVGIFAPTIGMDYKLSQSAKRANSNLPRMIDPVTREESVVYTNKRFIHHISILNENITKEQLSHLSPMLKEANCKDLSTQYYIKRGVSFDFIYSYHNGKESITFSIKSCE